MIWSIDQARGTAESSGIVIKFKRIFGKWVGNCLTPGNMKALIGESEGYEDRAARIIEEAVKEFTKCAQSGHSRQHCPASSSTHSWSNCPLNKNIHFRTNFVK